LLFAGARAFKEGLDRKGSIDERDQTGPSAATAKRKWRSAEEALVVIARAG
jgi:hypothetical protein